MPNPTDPLLRMPQVAERLDVSLTRAYAIAPFIPGVVRLGRSVRIPASALERFITRGGTVASTEPETASK